MRFLLQEYYSDETKKKGSLELLAVLVQVIVEHVQTVARIVQTTTYKLKFVVKTNGRGF